MTVIDTGPSSEDDLDEGSAADHIHGICLKNGPPQRIGVELEWLVRDARDPALPVPAGRIAAAVAAFGAATEDRDAEGGGREAGQHEQDKGDRGGQRPGRHGPGSQGLKQELNGRGPAGRGAGDRGAGGQRLGRAGLGRRRGDGRNQDDGGDLAVPGPGDNGNHGQHAEQGGKKPGRAAGRPPDLPTSGRPGVLPSGALLTTEPGGQLEISSQPADSLADLVRATKTDVAALRAALRADGLEITGIGLDPLRPPRRVLDLPRYAAMEAYFDSGGPWGRQMMCGTASVQVCLDAGDDSNGPGGYRWRWRLLHALGPVLVAAFANSPLREGKPTGWMSSRQEVWTRMDPGRTRPPRLDEDPRDAWSRYALDAGLMCVPDTDTADWSAPPGLTLRDWLRGNGDEHPGNGHALDGAGSGLPCCADLRRPTVADLEYHLSTLFPPVRPRGHFELRMIDAQRGDGWIVPLAVCSALLADERAGDAALAAVAPLWDGRPPGWPGGAGDDGSDGARDDNPWLRAARLGPADPGISRASRECFAAAREALDRMAVPVEITAAVDAFTARYVSKDRCPADDLLEEAK